MKLKRTLSGVICSLILCSSTLMAYATGAIFTDVDSGKWYAKHINYAVENGIFNGTSSTTFSPEQNMTRAQFVQVFANISNVDTSNKNLKTKFIDVPSGKWYTAAVKWAAENGVVNGIGNGKFAPDDPVTREQMCVMLVNYVEKYLNKTLESIVSIQPFQDDVQISSWAKKSVYKCANAKLVNGVGNNKFDPNGTTTRAQGATFFSNFHKYSIDNCLIHNYLNYVCTRCGEVDKSHAYEYLIEWVKENGSASGAYINFEYISENNMIYQLSYSANYDSLAIQSSNYYEGNFCFTILQLDTFFFGNYFAEIEMFGYINPETFTNNTAISYNEYNGAYEIEPIMAENSRVKVCDLIKWFEWCLETYDIGVTIQDLGFCVF